jgi:hypothetical protein
MYCKYPLKIFGKMQKIAFSQKSFSMWSIISEDIYFKDLKVSQQNILHSLHTEIAPGYIATKTEFEPVIV